MTTRPTQLRRTSLFAAAAMLLAACAGGSSADDGSTDIATESATSTTTTTLADTAASADEDQAVDDEDEPNEDDSDEDEEAAAELELPDPQWVAELRVVWEFIVGDHTGMIEEQQGSYAPILLEPGTYDTDAMLTPFRFTLDSPMRLISERHTFMVIVDPSARDLWAPPLLKLNRPHELTDPAGTSVGPPAWPDTIDGWDFDAWFAAHPAIDVERTELVIGGADSVLYDIDIAPDADVGWDCGGVRCAPLVIQYGAGPLDVNSNELMRLWVIPQGDEPPIMLTASTPRNVGWEEFGPKIDALVASIELGDPEPVPFSDNIWESGLDSHVPAGITRFPVLAGVEFDMPKQYFVSQSKNWSYIEMEDEDFDLFPPNVEIAAAMQTIDGQPIETAEQLAELFVTRASATRLPDAELAGRPATRVEMLGVQPGIPIFRHVALPDGLDPGMAGWFTQDYVEVWAVDTANGVLIVTAEADSAEGLEVALGLHEHVRESLVIFE